MMEQMKKKKMKTSLMQVMRKMLPEMMKTNDI